MSYIEDALQETQELDTIFEAGQRISGIRAAAKVPLSLSHWMHWLSEGSGLGLALVKAVAERHDATIKLRNLNPGFSAALTFDANPKP